MSYTTQMNAARQGIITPEMEAVAKKEQISAEELRELMAQGKAVIPANRLHTCLKPNGIGSMLRTKINVNLGTSRDCMDLDMELSKVNDAVALGAESIMDLSSFGDTRKFRRKLTAECPAIIGTVPIYDAVVYYHKPLKEITSEEWIKIVEMHAEDGVDFQTGVNNDTYEAYIDFASEHGIEYVILDEGWAVNLKADLMQVVPSLDLPALVRYAASKHVGIILWAGYHAFARDMEQVCSHYAAMGVKGFKVDFMDRDDQQMTDFCRRAAETCAKYRLVLDLHGMYKPAGMNRTYPNVLTFEGVNGLEQLKWSPASHDQVEYDVQIPFLRQVAGPMDYTQGAMRNASKGNYFPCNSEPMSQGTRCRQLALYVVFDSPLNMLCDSPSNYMREPESLDFIASIPTVWDETLVLQGKMGEYIVTARRKGDVWYVGGITDWAARDIELDCSFLGNRTYRATLFRDGANAHRAGRDYKRETLQLDRDSKLKLHLAPGGGFALKLE